MNHQSVRERFLAPRHQPWLSVDARVVEISRGPAKARVENKNVRGSQ